MYKTREVKVGPYTLGTGHPVRVQSMCNTDTRNAEKTAAQINLLDAAGCEINRVAVPDMQAAQTIGEIKNAFLLPSWPISISTINLPWKPLSKGWIKCASTPAISGR
jgi:(E)-4-hydroxy-3-methylbut-2-enyl-diphosphate synthase